MRDNMPSATDGQPRPFWLVGVLVLAAIVVVLAGAFVLDRALRAPVGVEPLPEATTGGESAPVSTGPTSPRSLGDTSSGTTQPTASAANRQSPEQAVEQAYLRYWDVYASAALNLDTSQLYEVATGDELQRMRDEIAGFRQAGYAVRVRVSHDYLVFDVTSGAARVSDEIVDRSFRVDPVTKNPPEGSNEATTVRDLFIFTRADGAWKVAKSVRESG